MSSLIFSIARNIFQLVNATSLDEFFQGPAGGAPPQPGVEIPSGAFVAKITNDAREDEMEENM